jgi:hypothetical protein
MWNRDWLEKMSIPEPNTGCLLWLGDTDRLGYGRAYHLKKKYGAHRVAFFIATGKMPVKCVLHSCDTPSCVNPDHLREGTMAENNAEAMAKGRRHRAPVAKVPVPHHILEAIKSEARSREISVSELLEQTFCKISSSAIGASRH